MSIKNWPGGRISSIPPTPSGPFQNNTASGMWTLDQVAYWRSQNQWPTAGNVPTDPDFEYVTLLLHGDGVNGGQNNTFLDSSTNNLSITRSGNTTQGSFSPYGPNWSNFFNGSSDYLTAPSNAAFAFGTGDYTVETWVFAGDIAYNTILSTSTGGAFFGLYAGVLAYYDPTAGLLSSSIAFARNTWTHVAFSRSSGTLRLFVNGAVGASSTIATNLTGTVCSIARDPAFSGPLFNGYISNLRIVKGTAIYTSAFTPSTTPLTSVSGTSILTCQSNRFVDNSSNNFTLTPTGTPSVQRFSPFAPPAAYSTATIGGSGYFDGTGDSLTIADSTQTDLGSGDFTVECWFYQNSAKTTSCVSLNSANSTGYAFGASSTANKVWWYTGAASRILSSTTFNYGTWNHIAAVRSGGTTTLYLNGASAGSFADSTNYSGTITYIGSDQFSQDWNGYISNVRIVKGTAVYTSTFTPPTAPVTAIANTQLLTNFTNGAIFDNAMMNDLETVGNAQISTSVVKFGTGSISAPTSGYLINRDAKTNLSSANFTVEFWVNSASDEGGYPGLVAIDSGLTGDFAGLVVTKAGVFVSYNGSSWGIFAASMGTVNDGTWRYIAVVRNGSSLLCFNNGVLQSTTSITSPVFYKGPATIVGKKADNFTTGASHIDDLRITKGVARYTANFTPPTAAFPDQ